MSYLLVVHSFFVEGCSVLSIFQLWCISNVRICMCVHVFVCILAELSFGSFVKNEAKLSLAGFDLVVWRMAVNQ